MNNIPLKELISYLYYNVFSKFLIILFAFFESICILLICTGNADFVIFLLMQVILLGASYIVWDYTKIVYKLEVEGDKILFYLVNKQTIIKYRSEIRRVYSRYRSEGGHIFEFTDNTKLKSNYRHKKIIVVDNGVIIDNEEYKKVFIEKFLKF